MNYWERREISLEILGFPFATCDFAHPPPYCSPLTIRDQTWATWLPVWAGTACFTMVASNPACSRSSPTAHTEVNNRYHCITLPPNWLFSRLSIHITMLPSFQTKSLDSYYPPSFIYCPWSWLGHSTEWPLDSDLPCHPHHNCAIQVSIACVSTLIYFWIIFCSLHTFNPSSVCLSDYSDMLLDSNKPSRKSFCSYPRPL